MKNVFTGIVAGLIVGTVLGTMGFMTDSTNIFLLAIVILAVLAFVPFVVKMLSNDNAPKPTIYGTSAPDKYTTVETKAEEKRKDSFLPSAGKAGVSAGAGVALFISFFVAAVIYL